MFVVHGDVLTLSATPIPRTMYMCMAGIRQMSTLHTPPAGRMPVQTLVMERDNEAMVDAVKEEMARDAQRIEALRARVALEPCGHAADGAD